MTKSSDSTIPVLRMYICATQCLSQQEAASGIAPASTQSLLHHSHKKLAMPHCNSMKHPPLEPCDPAQGSVRVCLQHICQVLGLKLQKVTKALMQSAWLLKSLAQCTFATCQTQLTCTLGMSHPIHRQHTTGRCAQPKSTCCHQPSTYLELIDHQRAL